MSFIKRKTWAIVQNEWCTLCFPYPSTSAYYILYLHPCSLSFHIICVKSQNPTLCRPDLWTAQPLPVYRCITGILENHQLTDLLVWALAKLSGGYSPIKLHSQSILFFGSWVIYCKSTSVSTVQDIIIIVQGDMDQRAVLAWFITAKALQSLQYMIRTFKACFPKICWKTEESYKNPLCHVS